MALSYQSPTRYLPDGYSFRGALLKEALWVAHLLSQSQFSAPANWHAWQTPRFNPAMDVRLVFDPRENLVGYLEVWLADRQPLLWGCVHPAYEGRGIGSALLRWGEARVRLAIDQMPASRWLAPHFSAQPSPRAHALCAAFGWQPSPTGPDNALWQYEVYEKELSQLN